MHSSNMLHKSLAHELLYCSKLGFGQREPRRSAAIVLLAVLPQRFATTCTRLQGRLRVLDIAQGIGAIDGVVNESICRTYVLVEVPADVVCMLRGIVITRFAAS